MNIWQAFGWRKRRVDVFAAPRVRSAVVESIGALADVKQGPPAEVTPKRVGLPVVLGLAEVVDVKCAWCNSPSEQRKPAGAWPSVYVCRECGKQSEVLAENFITRMVPSDTVARQIGRGEVV